ncbi:conserved Plasmodium protein, unknown function [Plasmodium ovale curtisi]|uniref:Uncharacterized protein n=1 Tax=Plasmodium ovale curtisi TaxID=864141 RepID=A0A1A8VMG9_PLAOA|nr:conserved Plasmodium protein, unknown function [Plasmodium ovale curtisi]
MKEEENSQGSLSIPGYYYDKKKSRYFLIDSELKKQLKEEEFNKLVNNAKKKNHKTNIAHKEYIKKKFHQIHGIKEMKKKKKNANNHKISTKNNYHDEYHSNDKYRLLNQNYNSFHNKEKNLQLINNELTFLKKSVSENQNIYNVIKCIQNYHFKEDSILSLPPIFINSSSCQYIPVEDLCELQPNHNSFYHKRESKHVDNVKVSHFVNIKRTDTVDLSLNDFKCFNLSQKLIDENKRKDKVQLEDINNGEQQFFDENKKNRRQTLPYSNNKTDELTKQYGSSTPRKNYCNRHLQHVNGESNISMGYYGIEKSLLIPKLYGRTYERLNSYNIRNIKSRITANMYKANFYYFYNCVGNSYNSYASSGFNGNITLDGNNIHSEVIDSNNVSGLQWDYSLYNIANNTTYHETLGRNLFEENSSISSFDVITNEARVSKTYKPSESFFHLFSNPQYEDIIFSTTKENNFSFSVGAIDLKKFIQKNKKSSMDEIIHENVYHDTDTKYLCSFSKEQSEVLCISPQILSHFCIFNSEYVAYSSYANTKEEKSLLCLLSIKSFFQCTPKIETYTFSSEINYFKLFSSMDDNFHKDNNHYCCSTKCCMEDDGYSYHHNNKLDKIFVCGSYPCFSFSTIRDSVPCCVWDSKKLKVHDLLVQNEDVTCYIENILNANHQLHTCLSLESSSQKKLRLFSKKGKERRKNEIEHDNRLSSYPANDCTSTLCADDTKREKGNKRKIYAKGTNDDTSDMNLSKSETSKKGYVNLEQKLSYVNNCLSRNNARKPSTLFRAREKGKSKHNTSHNYYSPNSPRYNYNDNKKKGICCESIRKSSNNVFLCCNTEHLYLCDLRCNFLNTISKLKPNEGYVNKIYSLSNNFQYILSKTNNHIGLYDMRCIPSYKHSDDSKNNLITTYERFIDNDNLKKHLNDFYVIDNEQYIVSLDTYTNSVYIYDIMNTTNKIINLDGNYEYSKMSILRSYTNLSKIPYIYTSVEHEDDYCNYYKKKINETKSTSSKHMNHFNLLKSYPKKDLFIGLNVQSVLPLFYVKQKYSKHNFISINEGGFICTINI